jgi:hypothetical protein
LLTSCVRVCECVCVCMFCVIWCERIDGKRRLGRGCVEVVRKLVSSPVGSAGERFVVPQLQIVSVSGSNTGLGHLEMLGN